MFRISRPERPFDQLRKHQPDLVCLSDGTRTLMRAIGSHRRPYSACVYIQLCVYYTEYYHGSLVSECDFVIKSNFLKLSNLCVVVFGISDMGTGVCVEVGGLHKVKKGCANLV